MADLNQLEASQSVKIAGANALGNETNFVDATDNNELKTADILNNTVAQGTVSVSVAGAPIEIKAGALPLANRKSVLIQAQGSNVVYGFSSISQPFTLANGSTITLAVGDGISIWVDRSSGAGSVTIAFAEFA